jgi:hypothetical protein
MNTIRSILKKRMSTTSTSLNKRSQSSSIENEKKLTIEELKLSNYGSLETSVMNSKQDLLNYKLNESEILIKLVGAPVNPAGENLKKKKTGKFCETD